jgi:Domain of unknown function (DUF1772)
MAAYTVLSTLVLLLSGWLAGAESASWALLQPVVARLDDIPQIRMQQGMLRTFGRVMPILLPLTSVLIVLTALVAPADAPRVLWVVAVVAAAVLIAFTLTVNVPINKRTLTWDAEHPPEGWRADRRRWHAYQGVRAVLLAVWFLCAVGAVTSTDCDSSATRQTATRMPPVVPHRPHREEPAGHSRCHSTRRFSAYQERTSWTPFLTWPARTALSATS